MKALTRITPFEAYYKAKPNLSHLREIGSRAFVLILNKHNPKVFQCLEECILIGYSKDSKSYRCYHKPSHRVTESFHVTFIEFKDDCDKPFRPGVMQGLDNDEPSNPAPNLLPIPPPPPPRHPPMIHLLPFIHLHHLPMMHHHLPMMHHHLFPLLPRRSQSLLHPADLHDCLFLALVLLKPPGSGELMQYSMLHPKPVQANCV
jgi:hypothetical protein